MDVSVPRASSCGTASNYGDVCMVIMGRDLNFLAMVTMNLMISYKRISNNHFR